MKPFGAAGRRLNQTEGRKQRSLNFALIDGIVKEHPYIPKIKVKAVYCLLLLSASVFPSRFLAASSGPGFVPGTVCENVIVRSWDTDSGIPHNDITAIVQDSDGYIWLGTPAGLVRFDGVSFVVFDRWNTPDLMDNRITSLYEDLYGRMWAGTDGAGLYMIDKGEWKRYGIAEGLESEAITTVAGDWQGNIWCGTELGLHRLDGGEFTAYGLDEGLPDAVITSTAVDELGRLWVGTLRGGVARFEGGLAGRYGYYEGLLDERVLSILSRGNGTVTAGTMRGIFELGPGRSSFIPVPDTGHYPATALAEDSEGAMLIGTMVEGLKVLSGEGIEDLLREDRLADSHIRSLLVDSGGYIWAGTRSNGLLQLRERAVGSIGSAEGFPAGAFYSPVEETDGTIWAGIGNRGLWRIRDRRPGGYLDREGGLAGDIVRAIVIDRSGRLWVGTKDAGLTIIPAGSNLPLSTEAADAIQYIRSSDGLLSDDVTAMLEDKTGTVWAGTDKGLNFFSEGTILKPGNCLALEGQAVHAIYESGSGNLYAGTKEGLWELDGAVFEKIAPAGGGSGFDVISIFEDPAGTVWAGTNGEGIRSVSEGKTLGITSRDGLPGDFIYSITGLDSGMLWISCETGVFAIHADSMSSAAEGRSGVFSSVLFDAADGMPSGKCSGLCSPAVLESSDGTLFYPTAAGLAIIAPSKVISTGRIPKAVPKTVIEEIRVDGSPQPLVSGENLCELPHRTGSVDIRFTALDFSGPGKLRFIYRLKGYDRDFTLINAGGERKAVYNGLEPGEYSFELRAVGNGGVWSEDRLPVLFAVAAPFYRQGRFIAASASALLAAGALVFAGSQRQKIRKRKMKYSTLSINDERIDEALKRLAALIEEEKVYLDPGLTLNKLALRVGIHYNHLSRIINERFSLSFSNYINSLRIEEAKKRLVSEEYAGKNISEVLYDVGFYSKSTFNTAFKKFTGMSPSEFRKKNR